MLRVSYIRFGSSRKARKADLSYVRLDDSVFVDFSPIYGVYTCYLSCCSSGFVVVSSDSVEDLIFKVTSIYNNIDHLHGPIKFIFT